MLFEDERRPWRAVPKDALLAPLAGPSAADSLDGCWRATELDGTRRVRAIRTWDTPPSPAPGHGMAARDLPRVPAAPVQAGLTASMRSTVPALSRSVSSIWKPAAVTRGSWRRVKCSPAARIEKRSASH